MALKMEVPWTNEEEQSLLNLLSITMLGGRSLQQPQLNWNEIAIMMNREAMEKRVIDPSYASRRIYTYNNCTTYYYAFVRLRLLEPPLGELERARAASQVVEAAMWRSQAADAQVADIVERLVELQKHWDPERGELDPVIWLEKAREEAEDARVAFRVAGEGAEIAINEAKKAVQKVKDAEAATNSISSK